MIVFLGLLFVAAPPVELPRDGLAEVARYRVTTVHYGIELTGDATLVVVREDFNPTTLVKTQKVPAVAGVKLMLMRTLPTLNWDLRDNLGVFADGDLAPLRLSLTSEEWCGNNYRELRLKSGSAHVLARSYSDDSLPLDVDVPVAAGTHLHEQLWVLARSVLQGPKSREFVILAPQSAYVPEVSPSFAVVVENVATERVDGNDVVRVDVRAKSPQARFPEVEHYWINPKTMLVVRAQVNDLGTELGEPHTAYTTYRLLDGRREPYWQKPLPPATTAAADRTRATFSSLQALNLARVFAERRGAPFDLRAFLNSPAGRAPPGDYVDDPKGVFRIVETRDGKGGFAWDPACVIDGKRGCFVAN